MRIPIISDIFEMSRTLKLLIISDIFVITGFGLIAPIFAIFINDNLIGGSIISAGLASMIFLLTLSVLRIYFSYKFNPNDRLWMLRLGTIIVALVPIGYILSTTVYHIYVVEFFYGLGAAFAYPAWSSLFTSHLEKGKRGFQDSIYSSSVGIGTAITAGVGAWIAQKTSFQVVFILTGIIAVIGLLFIFKLEKKALKKI
jgi:MFS family permease